MIRNSFFLFALLLPVFHVRAAETAPAGNEMAAAAVKFLGTLDETQKKRASFAFDSPERENWAFVPKERAGIPLASLKPDQQELVKRLLSSALSEKGLLKVDTIITLEALLAEMEKRPEYRDPTKYFTSIFGDPGSVTPWSWRFEGHHLSVNLTIVPGKGISATPSFLGANPAEVREGPKKGTRPLAAEEDLARTLATTLQAAGKAVVYTEQAPREILTSADRHARQLDPVGVPTSEMSAGQKDALTELIREYTGRFRAGVADGQLAAIQAQFDSVRFGWAGSLKPGEAYYYRVHGRSFLIEAANSQNNANHIHTVWRDLKGDFGRDTLGEHYQDHDHPH